MTTSTLAKTQTLVPVKSKAVTIIDRAQPVSKTDVPGPLREAIKDLLVAFSAGPALGNEDRARLLRLHFEAIDGFPYEIAELALQHLKWKNPQNPFAPTIADVRERCGAMEAALRIGAYNHYVSRRGWHYSGQSMTSLHLGPNPSEPDCWFSSSVIAAALRSQIGASWRDERHREDVWARISQADFDAIPLDGFPDGVFEEIMKFREAREAERARDAAARKREDDIRRLHGIRVYEVWWRMWLDSADRSDVRADELLALAVQMVLGGAE